MCWREESSQEAEESKEEAEQGWAGGREKSKIRLIRICSRRKQEAGGKGGPTTGTFVNSPRKLRGLGAA